ncbi:hypothetical protein E2C01_096365 [Portunus trituberculatus]|uniref:Uncharacterized protein n=1 Tax=Portunus trituberculatus TaxID=210409 RepID=A0A5B7JVF2_PORTR|nr:hypothetical protein [Portunus trituberculatus]
MCLKQQRSIGLHVFYDQSPPSQPCRGDVSVPLLSTVVESDGPLVNSVKEDERRVQEGVWKIMAEVLSTFTLSYVSRTRSCTLKALELL